MPEGLNAPILLVLGYHPGGWGKPPVDEFHLFSFEQLNYEEEPVVRSKHLGDLEDEVESEEEVDEVESEEEDEDIPEEELEDGNQSTGGDSVSSTLTGVETPDVIELRKQQRKEPDRQLYQVLEEKEEKIAPGTLLGQPHVCGWPGAQEKAAAAKRVDLLRGQKADKVDVSFKPDELEGTRKQGKKRDNVASVQRYGCGGTSDVSAVCHFHGVPYVHVFHS
ncbi:hypothetical protein MKW98_004541 [Papaver atlanticum]|uniref:Uncharacterized protein n=1 Tax=Papaver atlanticum TaxID=357466 RepID=A0AAD4SQ91_9MAGN|nr:hypothetical protein MKW98_004541 [Papaver atlanticum]